MLWSPSNTTATNPSSSINNAADTTLKMTRIVKNAEFPSDESDFSSGDIFERHCLHGGPVTAATIRFPPPPECMEAIIISDINNAKTNPDTQGAQDAYNTFKLQGRIVLARGSWIESHSLFPHHDGNSDSNGEASSSPVEQSGSQDYQPCCSSNVDKSCYKTLAFGGGNHGSSTLEGVSGMIFPSSSSSLSYLNEGNASSIGRRKTASSRISVVAYGGRRISFLSGGGLWNATSDRRTAKDIGTIAPADDNFAHISIMKAKNQKAVELPYLEVSDWVHDVRLLDIDSTSSPEPTALKTEKLQQRDTIGSFLLAMGMVNNNSEIWGFHIVSADNGKAKALLPTRLQCVTCDVRCMTYSLSFYGWDDESELDIHDFTSRSDANTDSENRIALPTLVAASGTVFGDIVVWGVARDLDEDHKTKIEPDNQLPIIVKRWHSDYIKMDNSEVHPAITSKPSRIRVRPSYHLKGHLGSVFSVKFGACGNHIASTSDDRSVRLWELTAIDQLPKDNSTKEESNICRKGAENILSSESSHNYTLVWTGWGHTARVWDVSFASSCSNHRAEAYPLLISAGEDSAARVWSPLSSKAEIAHPLRGHRCESLWSVAVCEGIIVTGGNDGCVKLFELDSYVRSDEKSLKTFVVPKDPQPATLSGANGDTFIVQPQMMIEEANTPTGKKMRKKKAKKKKASGQAICGMEFYGCQRKVQSKLLVATRAGSLFSLDLISHAWSDHSSWSEQVVSSSDKEMAVSIDPSTGSCIGVHPSGECVVVGTTKGWLVTSSLSNADQDPSEMNKNIAFQATSYRPVQSVSFIDEDNLLAFYARGSVIWFQFGESPVPLHVMTLGTTGVPLSFAYNNKEHAVYVGDSRGNIALFDLSRSCQSMEDHSHELHERRPSSLLTKVHGREHVTGITVSNSTGDIISIGNDGCMHRCMRDAKGELQKMMSIPIPNVTGLRHVWKVSRPNGEESVILGGFNGNDFVMLDSIEGYEFLRIATGGRQRQQDFFFSFANNSASLQCPNFFGMAILTGQKDGFNAIDILSSNKFEMLLDSLETSVVNQNGRGIIQTSYSIGTPVHSETINDSCWVRTNNSTYLLTGSNDCTVKLSQLDHNNTEFVSVTELPPHESCVRGVCSSRHSDSNSTLLVTCGGKQSMEFYILHHDSQSNSTNDKSQMRCCVSLLLSYRALAKTTIDHRMNAVRATPLHPQDLQCHFALSGDSDGNLHVCVVSEHAATRRTTIGKILKGNGRPVICIELLRCSDNILAFVGTTGGEIAVWVFPGSISLIDGDAGVHYLEGMVPSAPAHIFNAHQRGVNDLSVAIANSHSSRDGFCVLVCSVGDDQSLSTYALDFSYNSHPPDALLQPMEGHLLITKCASASALKAVKLVVENEAGFFRVFTTGHDEKITLWQLDATHGQLSIKHVLSSPLALEGNSIDSIHLAQSNGSIHEVIAVGGEGVELQSLDLNILHAANKLHEANYLLITTGAGFSADSGLQTYECAPTEYKDMCTPSQLTDNPYHFQQFWLNFTESYLDKKPHRGYELLHQWCQGGQLQHLKSSHPDDPNHGLSTPWWVYSSNVDGHFRMFKSFVGSLCEIHGSALEYRCASGIGYSDGEPRIGKEWDQWNQKMLSTSFCKQANVQMNQNQLIDIINSSEIFSCKYCDHAMRPNVLMFHDTDENVLKAINLQRERYQAWEALVEEEVAMMGQKLVILEMGCGVNVPAVRQESEEVLLDCAKKLSENASHDGSVCLIRINPKDAGIEMSDGGSLETISVSSTAELALRRIDCWLKAFARCQENVP